MDILFILLIISCLLMIWTALGFIPWYIIHGRKWKNTRMLYINKQDIYNTLPYGPLLTIAAISTYRIQPKKYIDD